MHTEKNPGYSRTSGYAAGKESMEKKNVPWYLQKGGVMA